LYIKIRGCKNRYFLSESKTWDVYYRSFNRINQKNEKVILYFKELYERNYSNERINAIINPIIKLNDIRNNYFQTRPTRMTHEYSRKLWQSRDSQISCV